MTETFNSREAAAFKDVWVFCEQQEGQLSAVTMELLSEGRRLADELGAALCGILLGKHVETLAVEIGGYGADRVYVYDSPLLKDYATDVYTRLVTEAVREKKPEIMLFGATDIGRDLAPRCAARLQTGLCADCTHLDLDMDGYIAFLREQSSLDVDNTEFETECFDVRKTLKMTMPAFGGHLMATIVCPDFRPVMATVRGGVMLRKPFDEAQARAVEICHPAFELTDADFRTEILETVKAVRSEVDLASAEFIVSVGGGIGSDAEKGLRLAEELAAELGGVVACSRAAVDGGWLPPDHQIGQTGRTVRPKVYIALGISGAIQHNIGMLDSQCVIAVNRDPRAPIFEIADYGICGDLFKVVPEMTASFRALKADK